jgi:glycosyltransferase involved in cell wall biosynthesis
MISAISLEEPQRGRPPWRIAHTEASLGWGGQERRVMTELWGFQKRGCPVWLIAPAGSQIYQRALASNVPVRPLAVGKIHFLGSVIRLARWLRENRIQILNTHSSRDGWLAGLAGRWARVPLLIRSRHIDVTYPNRWLSRIAFTTLADQVLTTSEKITAHLKSRFNLRDDQVSTVPTGIDLSEFAPEGPRAELPRKPGPPLVGMVSVLRSWKGHDFFLQAIERLNHEGFAACYVIVGDGPMRPHLERQIAERRLGECVALAGHREDVPAVLRALDLLVMPSTAHEGVPQIGLQALAVKTPVVGSDVGGIPEIIRPNHTGRLTPPSDAVALARAIREALDETEATRRMADRGRLWVEQNHSLDQMLNTLHRLYRRQLPPEPRTK